MVLVFLQIFLFPIPLFGLHSVELSAEKKLRDDLTQVRDWPVRPVKNYTDRLEVYIKFQLTSVIGLDLKDQVLSLNVRIIQEWTDYKYQWDPEKYGGIDQIVVPAESIWRPDFEHYNKFGDFYIRYDGTFARIDYTGAIQWITATVLRSFCQIEVRYYPFDIQKCLLTFGSWTYDGNLLYITLKDLRFSGDGTGFVPVGMDLSDYYPSSEWDLVSIPASSTAKYYNCCVEPYFCKKLLNCSI